MYIIKIISYKDMIKTNKYLQFEDMKLELQQSHPKEVSRAVLCLKDEQRGCTYKTDKYGEVQPQIIDWSNDKIEILYNNQQMFKFETICEHEYGYQISELEALYHGEIYIKTENFFRSMNVHVFNQQGEKCGIFKYIIKVVERQPPKAKKSVDITPPEPIQVSLQGKVTFNSASVSISSLNFKKSRYANDLDLSINICGQQVSGVYKKNYQWNFLTAKVQHAQTSPEQVAITLNQGGNLILQTSTTITHLQQNKRFITQTFPLYDNNNHKIGTIKIDLRYITKQQLLNLMYSPTKLAKAEQHKMEKSQKRNAISSHQLPDTKKNTTRNSRTNSSLSGNLTKNYELKALLNKSRIDIEHKQGRQTDRYKKVHVMNGYHEVIFSRAKRFVDYKNVNPNISYSDPTKFSDFSPSHYKGANISVSHKTDFTKQCKNNPGVGSYKLPSIWDKY